MRYHIVRSEKGGVRFLKRRVFGGFHGSGGEKKGFGLLVIQDG